MLKVVLLPLLITSRLSLITSHTSSIDFDYLLLPTCWLLIFLIKLIRPFYKILLFCCRFNSGRTFSYSAWSCWSSYWTQRLVLFYFLVILPPFWTISRNFDGGLGSPDISKLSWFWTFAWLSLNVIVLAASFFSWRPTSLVLSLCGLVLLFGIVRRALALSCGGTIFSLIDSRFLVLCTIYYRD